MESGNKRKVLVVDDNPSIRTIAAKMLSKAGIDSMTAANAHEAEKILRENNFDLIVLDVMMPGKDGYELCESLREQERFEDLPILFLSAREEHLDRLAAFSVGGTDYLTKPFMQDMLVEKINELLEDGA